MLECLNLFVSEWDFADWFGTSLGVESVEPQKLIQAPFLHLPDDTKNIATDQFSLKTKNSATISCAGIENCFNQGVGGFSTLP